MNDWRSLYIYYISGTGNARLSSQWVADEASGKGIKAVVQQIDRLENIVFPSSNEKALIGFVFPTHGFNAAPIMLRFIAGFPRGLCKNVFLLNTRAGMKLWKIFTPGVSGMALLLPAFMLMIKGYKCIGLRPVDLPSNWISLHPGLKNNVIDSINDRCEKIVRQFAIKILNGGKVYRGLLSIPLDILLTPVSLAYYFGGRYFLSKTFIANSDCNKCGLCIRECPTSSIKFVENRPYWKLSCESCMRCMNICPLRAIESAHGMAIGFWLIFTFINTRVIMMLTTQLNIHAESMWWIVTKNILGIGSMILIAAILYRIMHTAIGLKPVNYLIRYTSLTSWSFWRRYINKRNLKNQDNRNISTASANNKSINLCL